MTSQDIETSEIETSEIETGEIEAAVREDSDAWLLTGEQFQGAHSRAPNSRRRDQGFPGNPKKSLGGMEEEAGPR
jgi:hypothetical protein